MSPRAAMGPPFLVAVAVAVVTVGARESEQEPDGFLDLRRCRSPLGMQDGSIPDSRLAASSAWAESTAARHGRLGRSDGDGAWCPAGPMSPDESEFLEVDLGQLHLVTLVGTQGRHAGGHGREFTRSYRIHYSRDRSRWIRWRDRWGNEVLGGNEDAVSPVLQELAPAVVARALRVLPSSARGPRPCLRLELYGCAWRSGLLWYSAPQGQAMALGPAPPAILNDSTYDGVFVGRRQRGGLGQLADGLRGATDLTRGRERRLWPGYDYVGWRRPHGAAPRLALTFAFERPRVFHAMHVHCNSQLALGVSVFRAVECHFRAAPGAPWGGPGVTHRVSPRGTQVATGAVTVTVPLRGRRGRLVRCRFAFGGRWLLFSEVAFESEVLEELPEAPPAPRPGLPAEATSLPRPEEAAPDLPPTVEAAEAGRGSGLVGALGGVIAALLLLVAGLSLRVGIGLAPPRGTRPKGRAEAAPEQPAAPGPSGLVPAPPGGPSRSPPRYERIGPTGHYEEPRGGPPAPPLRSPTHRQPPATPAPPMGGTRAEGREGRGQVEHRPPPPPCGPAPSWRSPAPFSPTPF